MMKEGSPLFSGQGTVGSHPQIGFEVFLFDSFENYLKGAINATKLLLWKQNQGQAV